MGGRGGGVRAHLSRTVKVDNEFQHSPRGFKATNTNRYFFVNFMCNLKFLVSEDQLQILIANPRASPASSENSDLVGKAREVAIESYWETDSR